MKTNMSKEEFVKFAKPCANEVKRKFNIAPIISISQAAYESDWGNSKLAVEAYNLFGIKATESWKKFNKPVYKIQTTEYVKGTNKIVVKAEFRKYDNWLESFVDWATLISSLGICKEAYKYAQAGMVKEYGDAITGIYATDPLYSSKLVKVAKEVEEIIKYV